MRTSPNRGDENKSVPPKSSTAILLLVTMADTTWRMFVPVLGLLAVGLWGDNVFYSKPSLTIMGLILGVTFSALLVRQQLKKVKAT